MREVADPIYRAAAGLACVPGKGGAAETRRESRPGVAGADASGKEVPTTGAGESARGRRKRVTCGAAGESLTSRPGLSMGGRAARPSWGMGRTGDGTGLRARGLGRQGRKGAGRGKERKAGLLLGRSGERTGWAGFKFGVLGRVARVWVGLTCLSWVFPNFKPTQT